MTVRHALRASSPSAVRIAREFYAGVTADVPAHDPHARLLDARADAASGS
jgi:hypothetical protein